MKKSLVLLVIAALWVDAYGQGRFSPMGVSINVSPTAVAYDSQFPCRYDYVYGWRLSLLSGAHSRMIGLATALLANCDGTVQGRVGGMQFATLFNTAEDCEIGVGQISGFCNQISASCNGVQICSAYNRTSGYLSGVQIAIYNEVGVDCAGMQLGLFNRGGSVYGVQLGLVNFAKSLTGLQLGVLNFVDDSKMTMFPIFRIGW